MKEYYVIECNCKLKRIRFYDENTTKLYVNNINFMCSHCKSTFNYIGLNLMKADKYEDEQNRKYVKLEKVKQPRKKLTKQDYCDLGLIDKEGMPIDSRKGITNKQLIPAINIAIDENDISTLNRIFGWYGHIVKRHTWHYLSKKRKEFINKNFDWNMEVY